MSKVFLRLCVISGVIVLHHTLFSEIRFVSYILKIALILQKLKLVNFLGKNNNNIAESVGIVIVHNFHSNHIFILRVIN